jgi:hypothetical protein
MSIGIINDQFLLDIYPFLTSIQVLNLFEQPNLTEDCVVELFKHAKCIKSLCVNDVKVGAKFLQSIIQSQVELERLSIVDCQLITKQDLTDFLKESRVKKVYTECKLEPKPTKVMPSDMWFMDEHLDIFSLWDQATNEYKDVYY